VQKISFSFDGTYIAGAAESSFIDIFNV